MTPSMSQTGSPKIWPMIHFLRPLNQAQKQRRTKWSRDITDHVPCSSRQTRPRRSVQRPALACNSVHMKALYRTALFHFCTMSKIRNILSFKWFFHKQKAFFVASSWLRGRHNVCQQVDISGGTSACFGYSHFSTSLLILWSVLQFRASRCFMMSSVRIHVCISGVDATCKFY